MNQIKAYLIRETISSNSSEAYFLNKKSHFGEKVGEKIQYSLSEALFLVEKNKMEIFSKNKKILEKDILKKFGSLDKKIQIKYSVFRYLRNMVYVVKTSLKFGADIRVYEKDSKLR